MFNSLKTFNILCFLSLTLVLSSCDKSIESPELRLSPASFKQLPGWANDDLLSWVEAFERSCQRFTARPAEQEFGIIPEAGTFRKWQLICQELSRVQVVNSLGLRTFIEENFVPYQLSAGDEPEGLFTGYYEAALRGSRHPEPPYDVPLHRRPNDLVLVQLGEFRESLSGQRIAGRVINGKLKPYETRSDIVNGNWPFHDNVLVWVDNPIDAFFAQIQGSGLVRLEDGSLLRIGYDGHNGHSYFAIGRELIERGALTKETVSMQSIRQWLEANPDRADELMNMNRSYIFFREISGDGPFGAEGIALTAQRSLAIDHAFLPYGLPLWVDIRPPKEGLPPLQKLMVAQDTGGAIRGPVRGDVFWGYGDRAEDIAGHMKSTGRYWALLPR